MQDLQPTHIQHPSLGTKQNFNLATLASKKNRHLVLNRQPNSKLPNSKPYILNKVTTTAAIVQQSSHIITSLIVLICPISFWKLQPDINKISRRMDFQQFEMS